MFKKYIVQLLKIVVFSFLTVSHAQAQEGDASIVTAPKVAQAQLSVGENSQTAPILSTASIDATNAQSAPSSPIVGKHISSDVDLASMLTSLFVVVIIIFISAFLLKRFQLAQPVQGGLKIISSLPLGTKERLVVIQAGDKQVVVGVTPSSINLITELEEPLDKVVEAEKGENFQSNPSGTKASGNKQASLSSFFKSLLFKKTSEFKAAQQK